MKQMKHLMTNRARGTLDVRMVPQSDAGAFVLQHTGTMTRGAPALEVTVVPDPATDQLAGLSGRMSIIIEGKKHLYEFDYSLAG